MAAGDHNPSRRALLGAAVGVPLIACGDAPPPAFGFGCGGSPSPPDRRADEWNEALAAFRAAQGAVLGMERETRGASAGEEGAWLPRYDAACEAMDAALGRAIAAPAPDLAAFALKLELLFAHEVEPDSIGAPCVAIMADARRLLSPAC